MINTTLAYVVQLNKIISQVINTIRKTKNYKTVVVNRNCICGVIIRKDKTQFYQNCFKQYLIVYFKYFIN